MNTNNKQEKLIVPDQLKIFIQTSIPGYQKIEYKPSMTIKDTESSIVYFNPLVRLNQSTIDKMPTDYKVKQFFNKGLFESLITHTGNKPALNLTNATRSGYIDNNIKITLNTIFPVNSVIYIGKNPYAIGDVVWTNGDWKIDVKHQHVKWDLNRIKSPLLYNKLSKEEAISGEKQLELIPKSLVVGNNYMKGGDTSKLAYVITVDMELHPGTSLNAKQLNDSKCNSKYNAIRKAYSELMGTKYVINPIYPPLRKVEPKYPLFKNPPKYKEDKIEDKKGGKRKLKSKKTKRYRSKRNKTIKIKRKN
jgi:hypothetical protein